MLGVKMMKLDVWGSVMLGAQEMLDVRGMPGVRRSAKGSVKRSVKY
jgi:hypothetical protein